MSTIKTGIDPAIADAAAAACAAFFGTTVDVMAASQPTRTFVFGRDMTAAELATVDRVLGTFVRITPAEREAIQPDIEGLQTYQGLASPTLAQTASAVKAISRILRALIRN